MAFKKTNYLRLIVLFSIFHFVASCAQNDENNVKYYPNKIYFNNEAQVKIDLDKNDLFLSELSELIENVFDNDSLPYLQFTKDGNIKKVGILKSHNGLIRERNLLRISKDSIYSCKSFPLVKLDSILPLFFDNHSGSLCYSETPDKAAIDISLDELSKTEDLTTLLDQITYKVDQINHYRDVDSIKFKITFNYYGSIPPPPPIDQMNVTY